MRIACGLIAAAAGYVAVTFVAGFALGVLREFVVRPAVGEIAALLIEAPMMLAISFLAARWMIAQFMPGSGARAHLAMGLIALALLIGLEFVVGMALPSPVLEKWLARLQTPAGLISLALYAAFAVMPSLAARRA